MDEFFVVCGVLGNVIIVDICIFKGDSGLVFLLNFILFFLGEVGFISILGNNFLNFKLF